MFLNLISRTSSTLCCIPVGNWSFGTAHGMATKGHAANNGTVRSTICKTVQDKSYHVLFECKALYNKRALLFSQRFTAACPPVSPKIFRKWPMSIRHPSRTSSTLCCIPVGDWSFGTAHGMATKGHAANIGTVRSTICKTVQDKSYHVLFECKALYNKRALLFSQRFTAACPPVSPKIFRKWTMSFRHPSRCL